MKDSEAWHAAVHGVAKVTHDLVTEQGQQRLHYLREQLLEELESPGEERVHSREKRTFHRTLGHRGLLKGDKGI